MTSKCYIFGIMDFLALVNLAGVSLHGKLEQRPDWVSMILLHNRGGTKSNTETEMTLEKVTQQRRLQRLEFKKERAKLERELLELRKKVVISMRKTSSLRNNENH